MENYREKFIQAEEQAAELVTQLEALKKEALNYKKASQDLDEAKGNLNELITRVENVVSDHLKLIASLKEIGTQEIIKSVEEETMKISSKMTQEISSIKDSLSSEIKGLHAIQQEFRDDLTEKSDELKEIVSAQHEITEKWVKRTHLMLYIITGLAVAFSVILIVLQV